MRWIEDNWLESILGKPCLNLQAESSKKSIALVMPDGASAFLTAKSDSGNLLLLRELQKSDFCLADTALSFTLHGLISSGSKARFAIPDDELRVRQIARESFSQTRFHNDKNITKEVANKIKEEWAANYFSGNRGDILIVSERNDEVAGFLLAIKTETSTVIDLIAVDSQYRKEGCGTEMINKLAEQKGGDSKPIQVGTQIANISSLVFYQEMGFKMKSAQYVFHKHL